MLLATRRDSQAARQPNVKMILLIACVAQFMVVLDLSIVNVAIPSIRSTLRFNSADLQWVLNAYTISFAGLLLLGGRIADFFGRRKVLIYGLLLFVTASLLGALSTTQWELILARVLQGIGAAVVSPATLTIITTTFEVPSERAKALGAWSAVAGAGGAAGALFGGILTNYLSWRWTFLINIPIGVLEISLSYIFLAELRRTRGGAKLDVVGSVLITSGVTALVYALVEGANLGWTDVYTVTAFISAFILVVFFVYFEVKVAHSPIVPMSMLRLRGLANANAAMFMLGGAIFASWYFLSLYMQDVLRFSPLQAGLAFVPQTLAIVVGAQVSSRLVGKLGFRPLAVAGPIITALGLVLLSSIDPTSTYSGTIMTPSILITFGMGLSFTPLALAATSGVRRDQAGLASGMLNTSRQVGGAVGLAGLTSLAFSISNSRYSYLNAHSHIASGMDKLVSLSYGYGVALEVSAVIAIAAAVIAIFLPAKLKTASQLAEAIEQSSIGVGFEPS